MDDYILAYTIFTYLYMGHRYIEKLTVELPTGIHENLAVSAVIVIVLWLFSPVTFIFHVAYRALKH